MELKKDNWFVRTLIVVLTVALSVMVGYNFTLSNPPFQISASSITVILIITVLVLAEAFNNLSVGKILTLSKEVQKSEGDKKELRQENKQLRENLIQISSNFNQQSQFNATINGLTPETWRTMIGVTAAMPSDAESADLPSEKTDDQTSENAPKTVSFHQVARILEKRTFDKYISKYELSLGAIERGIQFTPSFQGLDPIAETNVVFDGYMKTGLGELFFEVIPIRSIGPIRWEKIYIMLSKIRHYIQAKNTTAELVLLLANHPVDDANRLYGRNNLPRFLELFQPSIKSGILRIESFEFGQEEYDSIVQELSGQETLPVVGSS